MHVDAIGGGGGSRRQSGCIHFQINNRFSYDVVKGPRGEKGQMGGAHESLLPGRVNALLIRCISHIAVGLLLFLRKERAILQGIALDCTPRYTKSKAAVFWRGYKVSRIGHFCDCISLSFSYISFSSPGVHGVFPAEAAYPSVTK